MTGAISAAAPARARARAFWTWWTAELADAVPARIWRRAPRVDIRADRNGILVERVRDRQIERFAESRRLDELDEDGWAELASLIGPDRSRLLLSPPDLFVTRIRLPLGAQRNLRSAIALQLNQAAPVDPELLSWNFRRVGNHGKTLEVEVAMVRTNRAEEIAEAFASRGLAEPALVARSESGEIVIAPGRRPAGEIARRRAWAAAALLLLSIPVTTMLAATAMAALAEGRIERLQEELAPRIAAERRIAREEPLRRALAQVHALPSATATIEGLALGLPDSAFAVSAERSYDGALAVETQTSDRAALESALAEAPMLAMLNPAAEAPAEGGRVQLSYRGQQR